jgi:NDP-sugar pyrophosphorylase family protein
LRPLTDVRAKPAIPVAGVPIARRIIGWLAGAGVNDLVLNLHYLPQTIASAVGDGSDLSSRVRYSWEQPVVLGSAGGPRQALSILGVETFLMVNGDVLTDVDLPALCEAHASTGADVTMALVPHPEPQRYGGVRLDASGAVTGFPAPGAAAGDVYHFVGVQIVKAEVFRPLPAGRPVQSTRGAYDELIARRPGSVRGFVSRASFWDVGTVADYWNTSWAFAAGSAAALHGARARLDSSSVVSRSILWDDVVVAEGCELDECIVADGVWVPPGTRLRRTIVTRGPDGQNRAAPF